MRFLLNILFWGPAHYKNIVVLRGRHVHVRWWGVAISNSVRCWGHDCFLFSDSLEGCKGDESQRDQRCILRPIESYMYSRIQRIIDFWKWKTELLDSVINKRRSEFRALAFLLLGWSLAVFYTPSYWPDLSSAFVASPSRYDCCGSAALPLHRISLHRISLFRQYCVAIIHFIYNLVHQQWNNSCALINTSSLVEVRPRPSVRPRQSVQILGPDLGFRQIIACPSFAARCVCCHCSQDLRKVLQSLLLRSYLGFHSICY